MANSTTRVWRKHVYVLIMSTGLQWAQIVLTLLYLAVMPFIRRRLPVPIPPMIGLSALVFIFCIWSTVHLHRGVRAPAPPSAGDSSALARRQALLTKMSAPFRTFVSIFSKAFALGELLAIVAFPFLDVRWVWIPVIVYYLFLLSWLAIEIVDWTNDQYILTEDRIIDIMRLPVIYEQRTEAPLAMVQNATTYQKGIGVILNFGNVQVETAGQARAILFESVWRPREIQEEIFQHIDALDKADRARQHATQVAQTRRWFEAYHTLAGGIRHIRYDETVSADQTIHIQWRIVGPANRSYRTWMEWDTISREDGKEEYANRLRPERKPWYEDGVEVDGIGSGLHHVRGFRASPGEQVLYFRITAWFEGEEPVHSSPEMTIVIRAAPRV